MAIATTSTGASSLKASYTEETFGGYSGRVIFEEKGMEIGVIGWGIKGFG